ncbi:hypothetical protein PspLS_03414 [Pyricularia sp. CBS 133598]|nr:hypothetical protein PspLS_03414 [Pyricularia sp. CBS 133598]
MKASIFFMTLFTAAMAAVVDTSPQDAGSLNRRAGPKEGKKCETFPGVVGECRGTICVAPRSKFHDAPDCK